MADDDLFETFLNYLLGKYVDNRAVMLSSIGFDPFRIKSEMHKKSTIYGAFRECNSFILRTENVKPMKPDSKNMTSWAPAVSVSYIVAPNRQYIKCFTNQKNRRQALYTVLRESSK